MKLLAIDTSTELCSAAVIVNEEVYSVSELAPRRHNEIILSMCEKVLNDSKIQLTDLDALAFGRGPGAFTGVRLAASIGQGIALAHDLPIVPVSSLAALAQAAYRIYKKSQVFACIDARMKEIYCAVYLLNDCEIMQLQGEERVISPKLVNVKINSECIGVGSGWRAYPEILLETLNCKMNYYAEQFPQAKYVAELGKYYFKQGQFVSALQALPVYLRDNVASKPKQKKVIK